MRPGGRSAVRHVARRSAPRIRFVHSIIGHDSPVFQHGGPFSGAAGATRLMRIVRRQTPPWRNQHATRCIAAGSQHYERSMSTLPDWPEAQHHPTAPLAGESLQRNWLDGPTEPLNAFGSLASAATNAPPGRLFRSNWRAVCLRGLSARSPRSKAQQAARPPTFRALSTARALVLSRFPLFWHKFTVVNDDGCLRKSLPHLKNSVNWGYAFFQTRWSS